MKKSRLREWKAHRQKAELGIQRLCSESPYPDLWKPPPGHERLLSFVSLILHTVHPSSPNSSELDGNRILHSFQEPLLLSQGKPLPSKAGVLAGRQRAWGGGWGWDPHQAATAWGPEPEIDGGDREERREQGYRTKGELCL